LLMLFSKTLSGITIENRPPVCGGTVGRV